MTLTEKTRVSETTRLGQNEGLVLISEIKLVGNLFEKRLLVNRRLALEPVAVHHDYQAIWVLLVTHHGN